MPALDKSTIMIVAIVFFTCNLNKIFSINLILMCIEHNLHFHEMPLQTLSCARLVFRTDVWLEEYFVPLGTDDIQTRMEIILACIHFGKKYTLEAHTFNNYTLQKLWKQNCVCPLGENILGKTITLRISDPRNAHWSAILR